MPQVVKSSKKMNFVDQASKKHGANGHGRSYVYDYDRAREEKENFKIKGWKAPGTIWKT